MPKSCKKRKLKNLKQRDIKKVETYQNGTLSRSLKQSISDLFKRKSAGSESRTYANNNVQKYMDRDQYGQKSAHLVDIYTSVDDHQATAADGSEYKMRRENQIEKNVFDAYIELTNSQKAECQKNTAVVLKFSYDEDQSFLTSVLIEMFNNEPHFQDVGSRKYEKQTNQTSETTVKACTSQNSEIKYTVGQTFYSGSFNLEVLDVLGQGSQATIYKVAKETVIYAAKVFKKTTYSKYLLQEYSILSSVRHENIIAVYDQIPNGFLMEKIPGRLLEHMRDRFDETTLTLHQRDQITVGLLRAVSYIHSRDIAHLDIKPENILLTQAGDLKLSDFGLALPVRDEEGNVNSLNKIRGSPPYLSPEILAGRPDNSMKAIDVWAVGVVMFRMFTGGPFPFGKDSPRDVYRQQLEGVKLPQYMRKVLVKGSSHFLYACLIQQLLRFQPEHRPSTDTALRIFCQPT